MLSTATEKSRTSEEWRRENEAFAAAIQNCDDETYEKIIAILTNANLLNDLK